MQQRFFKIGRILALCLMCLGGASIGAAQTLNIASGPEAAKPLQAGDPAPAFTVYDVNGEAVRFEPTDLDVEACTRCDALHDLIGALIDGVLHAAASETLSPVVEGRHRALRAEVGHARVQPVGSSR